MKISHPASLRSPSGPSQLSWFIARADRTRYVCGNPDDESLPCIRRVADSSEPQAQGIFTTAAIELWVSPAAELR